MKTRRRPDLPIFSLLVRNEADVVLVRQRARLVAELLGFGTVDQTRIATAVSEIARNAVQHGGGGHARFLIADARPQLLVVLVEDSGPRFDRPSAQRKAAEAAQGEAAEAALGEGQVGVLLARRLMDGFDVGSRPGGGTAVRLAKRIPPGTQPLDAVDVGRLVDELLRRPPESLLEELNQQQQELLAVLEDLTEQQDTLRRTNAELEETNRGVMALYAEVSHELDDTNRGVLALYAQLDDQAEELRRANALKDRFLSHLSHEFRTPLNSTLALSRLLLDRVDGPLSGEQEVQVRFIHQGAGELLELVNDLLDLAKIEAGRMDLRVEQVELEELLGGLRGMFRPLATGAELTLIVEDPPPTLPVLRTDRRKLSHILRNLVANAIKFTEQGEVRVSLDHAGDAAVFTVADTGVGISPEDAQRIFEDFVQAPGGQARQTQGTGLGLPLSRRLATLLGGTIELDSRPGSGSTFRLRLPLEPPVTDQTLAARPTDPLSVPRTDPLSARSVEAPPPALEPLTPATKPLPTEHPGAVTPLQPQSAAARRRATPDANLAPSVLVIDDDPAACYLVQHALEPSGCAVVQAGTAVEGLRLARELDPAAVFLDLGLPDRSGFEVLTEIRSNAYLRTIPIIIYTSRELDDGETATLSALAMRIMNKSDPALIASISSIGDALSRVARHMDSSERDS
jgi:signal transduction histidine kinase